MTQDEIRKGMDALRLLCLFGLAVCLAVIGIIWWVRMALPALSGQASAEPLKTLSGEFKFDAEESFAHTLSRLPRQGAYLEPVDAKEAAIRNAWPVGGYVNLHSADPYCWPWLTKEEQESGRWAEIVPAPGYVEQDDKTITMKIGNQVIVPDWYTYEPGRDQRKNPYTQAEIKERWLKRDGTVFKIVPSGGTP